MRCKACDTLLTDREARRKDHRGVHMDLCTPCGKESFEAYFLATEENNFDTQKKKIDSQST